MVERPSNWSILNRTYNEKVLIVGFESRLKDIALSEGSPFKDITFIVADEFQYGHKILFASNSGFFEGILEIADDQAMKLDITPSCFKVVKNFLYSNPSTITEANVFSIILEANKLLINGLEESCEAYILSPNVLDKKINPIEAYSFAKQYNLELIKDYCWWYFKMNFEKLQILKNSLTKEEYQELKKNQYPPQQYLDDYKQWQIERANWLKEREQKLKSKKSDNCSIQ